MNHLINYLLVIVLALLMAGSYLLDPQESPNPFPVIPSITLAQP